MVFHVAQNKVNIPRRQIAATDIEYVDNFNFLGIIIYQHINWNVHVNKIAGKISPTIGVLNKLKHTLPPSALNTIHFSNTM